MNLTGFTVLFVSALPATLVCYWLASLITYKLNLARTIKIFGFFVAWILTVIIAYKFAEQPSALSAAKEMWKSGFISAIISMIIIAILGMNNNDNAIYNKTNEPGWNKISSFPNLLFLFLYIFTFGIEAKEHPSSFHILIAGTLGLCIIPFLAGLYYNISKSVSNAQKYIYISTTVLMFWIILGSTARDFEEKGMMADSIMYRNASIGVFILSLCYILYLWITKYKESNSNSYSQYKTENKSQSISTYQEEKYYSIALKEIESNNLSKGLWGKAISYSDGNSNKAKSYYLKERAKQLMQMHQDKISAKEDERIEALRQLDKASKDLTKQHLSDKINIIKSSVFIFFEIFFLQMFVGFVYTFGSVDLVPNFPGIVNLSFSDIISTFLNSMIGPGLIAFLLWFPFHFLPIQAIRALPLWPPKIIAIVSLVLVILDYTRAAPLLNGTQGCGAYPCVLQDKAR